MGTRYVLPPVPAVEDTRELTVEAADAGDGQTEKPPQPETITSPAVVRRITAPKGRVLASALVTGDGCQPVIFGAGATKITGVTPWSTAGVTALGVPYDGHALAVTVLKTAGLEWKLPFVPS